MTNKCNYDPSQLKGVLIGMFHCPECGEMVLAGCPHPDYSLLEQTCDICGAIKLTNYPCSNPACPSKEEE